MTPSVQSVTKNSYLHPENGNPNNYRSYRNFSQRILEQLQNLERLGWSVLYNETHTVVMPPSNHDVKAIIELPHSGYVPINRFDFPDTPPSLDSFLSNPDNHNGFGRHELYDLGTPRWVESFLKELVTGGDSLGVCLIINGYQRTIDVNRSSDHALTDVSSEFSRANSSAQAKGDVSLSVKELNEYLYFLACLSNDAKQALLDKYYTPYIESCEMLLRDFPKAHLIGMHSFSNVWYNPEKECRVERPEFVGIVSRFPSSSLSQTLRNEFNKSYPNNVFLNRPYNLEDDKFSEIVAPRLLDERNAIVEIRCDHLERSPDFVAQRFIGILSALEPYHGSPGP